MSAIRPTYLDFNNEFNSFLHHFGHEATNAGGSKLVLDVDKDPVVRFVKLLAGKRLELELEWYFGCAIGKLSWLCHIHRHEQHLVFCSEQATERNGWLEGRDGLGFSSSFIKKEAEEKPGWA